MKLSKLLLPTFLILSLWPPAGGMAKPTEITHKVNFKGVLNYLSMELKKYQEDHNISPANIRFIERGVKIEYFIKKHCYALDNGKRFDLDELDTIILEEVVNVIDNRQHVFSIELED
jgi:hypothetical protein